MLYLQSLKSHYFVGVKGGTGPSVAGKLLVYLYCKGKIVPSFCMVILLQTTLCEMGLYISKLQVLFSHCSISTLSRCGIAEHPRGTGKAHLPYNHCNAARGPGQHVFFASVCSCSNLAGVCSHGFLQMPYLLYKNVKLPHYCEHFEEQGILFPMME